MSKPSVPAAAISSRSVQSLVRVKNVSKTARSVQAKNGTSAPPKVSGSSLGRQRMEIRSVEEHIDGRLFRPQPGLSVALDSVAIVCLHDDPGWQGAKRRFGLVDRNEEVDIDVDGGSGPLRLQVLAASYGLHVWPA
jgi:hypothetical protein